MIDKERLETLKLVHKNRISRDNGFTQQFVDDFSWLLQQAEKVEQLEKKLAETNNCIICGDDGSKVIDNAVYCKYC